MDRRNDHIYVKWSIHIYMSRKEVPFTTTNVDVMAGVCWRYGVDEFILYESNKLALSKYHRGYYERG